MPGRPCGIDIDQRAQIHSRDIEEFGVRPRHVREGAIKPLLSGAELTGVTRCDAQQATRSSDEGRIFQRLRQRQQPFRAALSSDDLAPNDSELTDGESDPEAITGISNAL